MSSDPSANLGEARDHKGHRRSPQLTAVRTQVEHRRAACSIGSLGIQALDHFAALCLPLQIRVHQPGHGPGVAFRQSPTRTRRPRLENDGFGLDPRITFEFLEPLLGLADLGRVVVRGAAVIYDLQGDSILLQQSRKLGHPRAPGLAPT